MKKNHCDSFKECFYFDSSEYVPVPKGVLRKISCILVSNCYSIPVLMRLGQLCYRRGKKSGMLAWAYRQFHLVFSFLNKVINNVELPSDPSFSAGVNFHHGNVCITEKTVVESGVHLYRNVLIGLKNGKAPHIKAGAKISSHSVVLGAVVIGENAIVAPGAVVVNDVPNDKIAGGVPAKIIGDVSEEKYSY